MKNEARADIERIIRDIRTIEAVSEDAFLALGAMFPEFSAQLERSLERSDASIASLEAFSGRRGGLARNAEILFASMGAKLDEDRGVFDAVENRDKEFVAAIDRSISSLSGLDSVISNIRFDSEEMEIISINALTVALKSGSAGKAFSVITDELKRLSANTIALTFDLARLGKDLLGQFNELKTTITGIHADQESFFRDLSAETSEGFRSLEEAVLGAATFFQRQFQRSEEISIEVADIMQNVQHQDIIRQSLDHVLLVLREVVDGGGDEGEEGVFLSKAAELSIVVLDDVHARLDGTVRSFTTHVEGLASLVADCERRRSEFHGLILASGTHSMTGFSKRAADYLETKHVFVRSCASLEAKVGELDDAFKKMANLMGRFKNIVMASRIEIAKTKSLQIVMNTVRGMMALTERIETDVSGAIKMTGAFMKIATTSIKAYASEHEIWHARMATVFDGIEERFGLLSGVRDEAATFVKEFALFTDGFMDTVGSGRKQLARIETLVRTVDDARATMLNLTGEADAGADASFSSERLRRLLDRFTIFTHKKAAADIAELSVEQGADAGNVTLF